MNPAQRSHLTGCRVMRIRLAAPLENYWRDQPSILVEATVAFFVSQGMMK